MWEGKEIMEYSQYVKYQTEGPGMIKKPLRYRTGERRAIDWFFQDIPKHHSILDIGCGTGVGIRHLRSMGYINLRGIELNFKKVEICKRRGLSVFMGDAETIRFPTKFDVIWSSHSFEHMLHPNLVMQNLLASVKPFAYFFFILPYVDTGPKEVHCASDEIGTRIDDKGASVINWFSVRGLKVIETKFDNFRENEIWLKMQRI